MNDVRCHSTEKAIACGTEHQHGQRNPRPVVLPTYSSRTLHHPSFLPLYMTVGSAQCNIPAPGFREFALPAMIPSDIFYTDPTLPPGSRVSNGVTQLEAFECCQLNTPPPVMSVIADSPSRLDPFRARPHPTRDLGSQTWTWDSPSALRPSTAQGQTVEVIQISAEEDEAITSLLKLHYQSQLETASGGPWGNMTAQNLTVDDHQSQGQPVSTPPSLSDPGPQTVEMT